MLKQLASVFDLDWDDPLDKEDVSKWLEIKTDLIKIDSVEIKICVSNPNSGNITKYTLVCFCYASIKAFATSIYLLQ